MSVSGSTLYAVKPSPWPICVSMSGCCIASSLILALHGSEFFGLVHGVLGLLLSLIGWWRDLIVESTFQGCHTAGVQQAAKEGMVLFILSEAMFFFGFFWAYFHSALAPTVEIGMCWPPTGTKPPDPFKKPAYGTAVLVSSGFTVNYCMAAVSYSYGAAALRAMVGTVTLGAGFSLLQASEFYELSFTIADSVYGGCFYALTGLHGLHVLGGTIFLIVGLTRLYFSHFSSSHHLGLECAAWYWHFVDAVWVVVYLWVYLWPYLLIYFR